MIGMYYVLYYALPYWCTLKVLRYLTYHLNDRVCTLCIKVKYVWKWIQYNKWQAYIQRDRQSSTWGNITKVYNGFEWTNDKAKTKSNGFHNHILIKPPRSFDV